ncbi:MAG: DUF6249 domain-containing protein [Bacteroidales bacterium]|nr:DUF6249 domain-containing protein [Bacteroidales bacterium]
MKNLNSILLCIMFVFGTCTVVWAQNHRHSTRTESVEDSVVAEAGESIAVMESADWDDDLEDFINKAVNDAVSQSYHHDRDGWLIRNVDRIGGGAIFIVALSVFCVFFGPVILIALILYFIYKRKKSRDAVVMEALRNGRDIPYGYGSSSRASQTSGASGNSHQYNNNTGNARQAYEAPRQTPMYGRFADQPVLHDGIKKVAIGFGVFVIACFMSFRLLAGIGWFIVIFGIGQIIIGYLSAGKVKKPVKEESKYTRDEPKTEPAKEGPDETPEETTTETTTDVTTTQDEKPE